MTVVSRSDLPAVPFTHIEASLIRTTFLLAQIVESHRYLIQYAPTTSERYRRRQRQQRWEQALDTAWDLLRAVRSGRYSWAGTAEFVPRTMRGKIRALMADGDWHSADEVAAKLQITHRKAVTEMAALTKNDVGYGRRNEAGWYRMRRAA